MDISLHKFKTFLFLLAFLASPFWGQAQVGFTQDKTAFKNMPLKLTAQSVGVGIVLVTNPEHGEIIDLISGVNGFDTLVYLPNTDFTGLDKFTIEHITDYPPQIRVGVVHTTFKISVVPSLVEVQHDYALTTEGKSTSIRVVSNDSVSHGPLFVNPVFPVVNHGTVSVGAEQGFVDFVPETGFTGLADFNYIACDAIGTCATGSVTIYVNPTGAVFNDAIRLGTGQNSSKAIPMPFHVTSVEPASHVKVENSQYAVVYEPSFDFIGQETFTVFGENGNQRTIIMDVIERPINSTSLAIDDVVYAALGESIDINVLTNDLYIGINRVDFISVQGGTISNQSGSLDGEITFTPDEDFRGVARILYRVFDSGYEEHLGFAYIVYSRNNFAPNVKDYRYTYRVNPGQSKIIEYNAPIDNYSLLPTPGFDNVVGSISAFSNHAIQYQAPEEGPITDEFEISYCVPANSTNCQQIKIRVEVVNEKIEDCTNDCVYPGDLNADGIVNSADLLPLGLYVGQKGPARTDQSTSFKAHEAADWNMAFVEEEVVNLKHYDANGDGVITQEDAAAIIKNYGSVYQLIPNALPALSKGISITPNRVTPSPEEIAVGETIPAGSKIEIDILLGDENAQELDLYGFTFPFKLSGKSFIDSESFSITFKDGSWAALNAPTLNLAQNIAGENSDEFKFDLAFTRTSGKAVSGIGPVVTVGFITVQDLEGFKLPEEAINLNIEIGEGYAIDGKGKYYQYEGTQQFSIPITFEQKASEELVPSQLLVFPNPVGEKLNVHLNSFNYKVNAISLYNITGQEVYRSVSLETKRFAIPVHNLPEGLYIMSVQTDGGVLNKKIEVLRK